MKAIVVEVVVVSENRAEPHPAVAEIVVMLGR
jgi:hypothetical protein